MGFWLRSDSSKVVVIPNQYLNIYDAILVTRTGVDDRFLVGRHELDRNPVE